jgi:hypothetical protein
MSDTPADPSRSFYEELERLPNDELLTALDQVLLELERRLFRYAHVGAELQVMADEGLLLSTRAAARLSQSQSAAAHTQGHLQLIGVGEWAPSSTRPGWNDDARVQEDRENPD